DIGGFTGSPGAELFTRWFQLATFLPFFRSHAAVGVEQQEPWAYGEPYTAIMRRFLQLRYALMPYWYTLAWETAQQGTPLVRPMFWEYPEEAAVDSQADQFMLGPDLLVAPVLEANSQARQVWLPPGRWYSWWRPETWYQGPRLIQVETSLDEIPLFVRGGAILPLEDAHGLRLHLYLPAADGLLYGRCYQDAGDGDQAGRLDIYQGDWQQGVLRLERRAQGDYQPPSRALRLYCFGAQFDQALVDGVPQSCQDNRLSVDDFAQLVFQ
ncbi:MAG: hypothetical protein JW862_09090, partial [Anaerolineales bacterium]|nr:hypothetical protein [Anaerolineales bacterium]